MTRKKRTKKITRLDYQDKNDRSLLCSNGFYEKMKFLLLFLLIFFSILRRRNLVFSTTGKKTPSFRRLFQEILIRNAVFYLYWAVFDAYAFLTSCAWKAMLLNIESESLFPLSDRIWDACFLFKDAQIVMLSVVESI